MAPRGWGLCGGGGFARFVLVASIVCCQTVAGSAVGDVTPVWQVEVTQSDTLATARVVVNAFADPSHKRPFPLRELPVRHLFDRSTVAADGRISPRWWAVVNSLEVDREGRLASDSLRIDSTAVAASDDVDGAGERSLPVPRSFAHRRYYSADGQTILVLRPHPGWVQLFDLRSPLNVVPVGSPFEGTDEAFVTGAVSGDGAIVAIQMIEHDDSTRAQRFRVVVFNRRLEQQGVVLTHTTVEGLQFEGRQLFVGMQRNPIPLSLQFQSTTEVRLYDLSALNGLHRGAAQ